MRLSFSLRLVEFGEQPSVRSDIDLPLLRTEVSPSSDSSENPGGLLESSSSPVASLAFSISSAARCTPLSNTWSAILFQSAGVKSLLLNVSRIVSGDV